MSIDFDRRLDPKVRRRSLSEIEEMLAEEYVSFLNATSLKELFARVIGHQPENVKDAIIEEILDRDPYGKRDQEFQKSLDPSALEFEEY